MTEGYRVGQEVEVTYRARVAEVGTRGVDGVVDLLRLESDVSAVGWVDPHIIGVEVIRGSLPIEPGVYRKQGPVPKNFEDAHHTDSWEFYYLNCDGFWSDLGWGEPTPGDALVALHPLPF
jgi:hypothetical protein